MQLELRASDVNRTDDRTFIGPVEQAPARPGPDQSVARRPSSLAREVARVQARRRLERELRSIAIDLLGPDEYGEFPAACADWVATTTEAAVSRVCDAALEALVQTLDSLLVGVPPDVARHLDRARIRQVAGFV